MKTFTVAGTSIENGTMKFRAANDLAARIKMLERCDNTSIQLIALPQPMSKPDAAAHLLTLAEFSDKHPLLVSIVNSGIKAAPKTPKAKKAPAAAAAPAADVVVDEESAKWHALVAEKRIAFPSHTEEQLLELVRFQARVNLKAFNDIEPNF
jgi:hypothetical protein|tara:strand:- start:165 stop:620 length:456 start_codon:yes stop_codon:yes gene_type:complete